MPAAVAESRGQRVPARMVQKASEEVVFELRSE